MIKESSNEGFHNYSGAKFEKLPEIELIKDGDRAILYDPKYSLLSSFGRIYLLTNGDIYGAEIENTEETVKLIYTAMQEMGIKSIKAICGGVPAQEKEIKDSEDKKTITLYKKFFSDKLSKNAKIKAYEEYKKDKIRITGKIKRKRNCCSWKITCRKNGNCCFCRKQWFRNN